VRVSGYLEERSPNASVAEVLAYVPGGLLATVPTDWTNEPGLWGVGALIVDQIGSSTLEINA
jgi:hypothetical protein